MKPWISPNIGILLSLVLMAGIVSGCADDIQNAGDLGQWVKKQAVRQGCIADTVDLEEWFVAEAGKNNWHGTCVSRVSNESIEFSINVDSVWTASSED